ncbi:hypothetical protein ACFLYY_00740 [Patescibacteria group bacterium]
MSNEPYYQFSEDETEKQQIKEEKLNEIREHTEKIKDWKSGVIKDLKNGKFSAYENVDLKKKWESYFDREEEDVDVFGEKTKLKAFIWGVDKEVRNSVINAKKKQAENQLVEKILTENEKEEKRSRVLNDKEMSQKLFKGLEDL